MAQRGLLWNLPIIAFIFFFPFYRAVTTENLMYIKEDLIIPHVSNIRGKDSHSKKRIQKKKI